MFILDALGFCLFWGGFYLGYKAHKLVDYLSYH